MRDLEFAATCSGSAQANSERFAIGPIFQPDWIHSLPVSQHGPFAVAFPFAGGTHRWVLAHMDLHVLTNSCERIPHHALHDRSDWALSA